MGQVSPAIEQDSSFVQDELESGKNCYLLVNLTKVSDILDSIAEGSGKYVPTLATSPTLQLPGMSLCLGDTIINPSLTSLGLSCSRP